LGWIIGLSGYNLLYSRNELRYDYHVYHVIFIIVC
jgi:hypothetical protein